jgi:hypothetical protein
MLHAILLTHNVVAILLLLCALILSWNAVGRRVVNAVASLQFILGLAVAGIMGANHLVLPPMIWVHLIIGLAVVTVFGMAMAMGKRAGRGGLALGLSIAGIVMTAINIWLGMTMAG